MPNEKHQHSRSGRPFERAVYEFLAALSPDSEVIFDHRVADRDTGQLRQCDAWINGNIHGLFPLKALVSCKDWASRLDIGEIETFASEMRSTGANYGIIYSSGGFTDGAIKKGEKLGIACCLLYKDARTEIPNFVSMRYFHCRPRLNVNHVTVESTHIDQFETWQDLFDLEDGEGTTLLTCLCEQISMNERSVAESGRAPTDWTDIVEFQCEVPGQSLTKVRTSIRGTWRWFRAEAKAQLVNGSYCFQNNQFIGSIATPAINVDDFEPGDLWEECEAPDDFSYSVTCIVHNGDIRTALQESYGRACLDLK